MNHESRFEVEMQAIADSWMNKSSDKKSYYDFWETMMDFCVSYPFAALVSYASAGSRANVYSLYLLSAAMIYLAAVRNIIRKNYIYLLCQAPLFVGAYYFPAPLVQKVIAFVYITVACILSINKRSRRLPVFRGIASLAIGEALFILEYLIALGAGYTFIQWIITFHCIAYSLSMLVYMHVYRTEELMEWEIDSLGESVKGVKYSSHKFIVFLCVPFIAALLAAVYGELLGFRENLIVYLMNLIGNFLKHRPMPQQAGESSSQGPDIQQLIGQLNRGSAGKESEFIRILGILGKYTVYTVVFLICVIILKTVFDLLYNYLSGRKEINNRNNQHIFAMEGIAEGITERISTIRKRIELSFGNSRSSRIRRIYINLVEHGSGKRGIKRSSTPHMIEVNVMKNSGVDISPATAIYEKARYGKNECTDEDVKKMKSFDA